MGQICYKHTTQTSTEPPKKTSTEKILKSQVLFCYLQVYLEYLRMRSSYLVYMIKRLGNGTVTE